MRLKASISALALMASVGIVSWALVEDQGELIATPVFAAALTFTRIGPDPQIVVTENYTETASGTGGGAIDGKVISPGVAWLRVSDWYNWDSVAGAGVYDPRLHDIEYYWTVPTKPGGADFSVRSEVNLATGIAGMGDMSIQRGPSVAIPLPVAGTYVIRCFAVEVSSGKTATHDITVTTVSEDDAFPTTRTLCYSVDNNFTGAPSGASTYTSLASLQTQLDTLNAGSTTYRVLFRRGETYLGTNLYFSTPATTFPNFRTGVYGTGADPIVTAPFGGYVFVYPSGATGKYVHIGPLDWRGRWDQANENGHATDNGPTLLNNMDGGAYSTLWGMTITGTNAPLTCSDNTNAKNAYISTYAVGYRQQGLNAYDGLKDLAFIGSQVSSASGSVDGASGRSGTGEYQSPWCNGTLGASATNWVIRANQAGHIIMQHCFFANSGGIGPSAGWQRCLRFALPTTVFNLSYNVVEGGSAGGVIDFQAAVGAVEQMNAILDTNLCVLIKAGGFESHIATTNSNGMTVRNNYCLFANAGGDTINFFRVSSIDDNALAIAPIKTYNNTVYSAGTGFVRAVDAISSTTEVVSANNLVWNASSTDDDTTTSLGYSFWWQGKRLGFPTFVHTLTGTWTNGGTFTIPYSTTQLNEQDGTVTDETYWDAVLLIDTKHGIRLKTDGTDLYAEDGDFSIEATASGLVFTNNTGGNISVQDLAIKVDRASELTTDTSVAPNTSAVLAKIGTASPATYVITPSTWATNPYSDRDISDTRRGGTVYQGAVEYA